MNIDNNTNISNVVSQSLSGLKLNNINRPYKSSKEEANNDRIENEELLNTEKQTTELSDSKLKNSIDVEDIKKYASLMGEDLSIDDINYGLMYGRSVIAEYSV